jgi:hypothetical protein
MFRENTTVRRAFTVHPSRPSSMQNIDLYLSHRLHAALLMILLRSGLHLLERSSKPRACILDTGFLVMPIKFVC